MLAVLDRSVVYRRCRARVAVRKWGAHTTVMQTRRTGTVLPMIGAANGFPLISALGKDVGKSTRMILVRSPVVSAMQLPHGS